tara:strand:+ start:699 stop:950 length:252 start_codon:yes stop_codon:yes gene_type:complete
MTTLDDWAENFPDAINYDGLEAAIIGHTEEGKAIYDYEKIVMCFMKMNDWDRTEAVHWTSYNVECMHVGEMTPIISYPIENDS